MITGQNGDNIEIQRDDDSDTFADDAAASAFVVARAKTNAPGTKLHQIALGLIKDEEIG